LEQSGEKKKAFIFFAKNAANFFEIRGIIPLTIFNTIIISLHHYIIVSLS